MNVKNKIYNGIEYLGWLFVVGLPLLGLGVLSPYIPWVPIGQEVLFWEAVIVIILIVIKIERVRSEKQTRSQVTYQDQAQFLTMYERSPTPYLTIDNRGLIVEYNQAAVLLFDANVESLRRENLFSLINTPGRGDLSILQGKIKNGMTINEIEVGIRTFNGGERWVLLSTYEFRSAQERLVSLVDVTQQKQVDRAKSEFVALATHQLRTPVSAIRWNLELLEQDLGGGRTESQDRYLQKIHRNVLRMISLINDFLNVSKLETGSFATSLEPLPLADFLISVRDEYQEQITAKSLRFELQAVPSDFTINTDKHLLHIIVSNLLSNAVKYSTPNTYVSVSCQILDDEVVVTIANGGIGIPAPEIDKLFTKFFRASNAQVHHTEGTGLGLYAVKQSVEKLGGSISVQSEVDKETVFTVRLPNR